MNELEVKFFNVGCGDGISIRFFGDDKLFHNVIIDGGTERGKVYDNTLKKELERITLAGEIIDLWIITHIDDDHIGGILRFIKDKPLIEKFDLSKTTFWFNYSSFDYDTGLRLDKFKSVHQGITLREFLKQNSKLLEEIHSEIKPIELYGARLTILSPSLSELQQLKEKWEKAESNIRTRSYSKQLSGVKNDYSTPIEGFDLSSFKLDASIENSSSIAFLFEYADKKILFTGDSHPTVLVNSLNSIGYSAENKLILDRMQIPHHGSKGNFNNELLAITDCSHFVISGDGVNRHSLPNKVTLARILNLKRDQAINFHITGDNNLTRSIFKVDTTLDPAILNFPNQTNFILFSS